MTIDVILDIIEDHNKTLSNINRSIMWLSIGTLVNTICIIGLLVLV